MFTYQNIPYLATGFFVLLMSVIVIYLIRVALQDKEYDAKFEKQLKYNIDPLSEQIDDTSWLSKKWKMLPNLMIKAEMVDKETPVDKFMKQVNLLFSILFLGGTILTSNPLAGITLILFIYTALFGIASFKVSKVRNLVDEQIPAFISSFKANIQANIHAQNAMIRAINNTASPLYDELSYAKAIMEAGDFRPGIIALRQSTTNETLRQMASCIELASSTGSNIEDQIEIIEDIITDKQEIEREKKLGINENKPLFLVVGLFVPLSFIGSYAMSEMHRNFWFDTTLSWIVLIGVIITMIIASFLTWKVIQKIDTV